MTSQLKQERGTGATRSVRSVLLRITAAVAMATILPIGAQNLTLPQLEYRYDDAQDARKCAEKAYEKAFDAYEDATEELKDLNADKAELQADIDKAQAALKKAPNDKKQDLEKEVNELLADMNKLQAKIDAAGKIAGETKKDAEKAVKARDAADKLAKDLKAKVENAKKNSPVAVAKKKLATAEKNFEAAEEARDAMQDMAKAADRKISKAEDKLADLKEELKEAEKEASVIKAKLQKVDAKKDKDQAAKLQAKAAEADKEVKKLQDNAKATEGALAEMKKNAAENKAKLKEADKKFNDAKAALATAEKDLDAAKITMKTDQVKADAEKQAQINAGKKAKQEADAKKCAQATAKKTVANETGAKAQTPAQVAKASVEKKDGVYKAPWIPEPEQELAPALQGGQKLIVPEAKSADIADPAATLPQFDVTMVSGDKNVVEKLQIWKDWSAYIVFNKVTPKQVNEFHGQLLKALRDEGYVFANVTFPTRIWSTGIFLAKVDLGVLGDITVKNQKHYSAEQIAKALRNDEGRFNYAKVHSDLFDLNVKPDLKLNTQLSTAMINGRRVINADIEVDDKLPIHGAIELSNTGSKASDSDWRLRATLQHLNLTKHGDSLTLDYLTGGDVADNLNAVSASYFLPINDTNHLNVYAGYSANYADDVLPEISVRGKGFFAGFAWTHTLYENVKERVEIALGWYYQKNENYQDLAGLRFDNGDMTVSMPTITLGYSSKIYDKWNGRNFASITLKQNRAGTFGSSSKRQFIEASAVDGDFFLTNINIARFQRLFAGEDHPGKWTLYAKGNVQIASDTLPSIMRDYVGGQNSVRGYEESELGGDNTYVGSLELRTPLVENFIPGLKKEDEKFYEKYPEHWSMHRFQFVAFTDFGYVSEKDKQSGADDQGFWSVGAGIRLGLTKYAQMSLDYGYPIIIASEETPEAGRFHFSLQLQF